MAQIPQPDLVKFRIAVIRPEPHYAPEMEVGAVAQQMIGAHDWEGAGEVGERFGCSAADSVHQQAVRGDCLSSGCRPSLATLL